MSIYEATEPPCSAPCDISGCGSISVVRLLVAPSRFTADGVDHSKDPPTFDACELHWPEVRDAAQRNGYPVADITGNLAGLVADFPQCNVFCSDSGRLYASARVNGSVQGATVAAWLVGQLRAQLQNLYRPVAVHHRSPMSPACGTER